MRGRSGKAIDAAAVALGAMVLAASAGEARGSTGWQWPVEGSVITQYSNEDADPYAGGMHRGIDIAAPVGTPVRAARAGKVTYAGAIGYSGLTVAVRTVDGHVTSYLHLSAVAVRRGELVAGGTRLGEVGATGRRSKTEPHLHFGVRVAGEQRRYVDPLSLLPPLPGGEGTAAPAPEPVPVAPAARPAPAVPRTGAEQVPRRLTRPHTRRVPLPLPPPLPERAAATALHPVPVAPGARLPVERRMRVVSPRAPALPQHARDWGRPLALAGLGLVMLVLFGRSVLGAVRNANEVLSRRAYAAVRRALRPARAYVPRSGKATESGGPVA